MTEFTATANAYAGIKGSTTINHFVRLKLNVSLMEYVLLDFICSFARNNPKQAFTEHDIYRATGYHFDTDTKQLLSVLRTKGLIRITAEQNYYYETTDLWNKNFDISSDFDEFWQIFKKTGNKQKAIEAYAKTRKIVDKETLHKAAVKYVEYRLSAFGEHTTHASSYLNPKNKAWEDIVPEIKKKDEPKPKPKFNL